MATTLTRSITAQKLTTIARIAIRTQRTRAACATARCPTSKPNKMTETCFVIVEMLVILVLGIAT